MAIERRYKAFLKSFETAPEKGYSAVNRGWFIYYELHVVIFDKGLIKLSSINKGNVHDINYLKSIDYLRNVQYLLGDRAYHSNPL